MKEQFAPISPKNGQLGVRLLILGLCPMRIYY